jgi:hypothetical protein
VLAEPAQPPDGPVTYADLVVTFLKLYDPEEWPLLAERLQQLDTLTSPAVGVPPVLRRAVDG